VSWKITEAGLQALEGRLSTPQRRVLEDIRDDGDPARRCRGRSMFGGLTAVLPVILRNKWAEELDDKEEDDDATPYWERPGWSPTR
jgi:hypothetical protein